MAYDPHSVTLWVSHSRISDFRICPRAYFLKNEYRDPKTRHKIKLVSPPLSVGQAVHAVIESLARVPVAERFKTSLVEKLGTYWPAVSGKKGGFASPDVEARFRARATEMLSRVTNNPGPLARLALPPLEFPKVVLSEKDGIVLTGKIDWLEYLPETNSIHIIDFKTGKNEEDAESLQLPIYYILASSAQKRTVTKASYWYLDQEDGVRELTLPGKEDAFARVNAIARDILTNKKLNVFKFPEGDKVCFACRPYEAILRGEAEPVGIGGSWGTKEDMYIYAPDLTQANDIIH